MRCACPAARRDGRQQHAPRQHDGIRGEHAQGNGEGELVRESAPGRRRVPSPCHPHACTIVSCALHYRLTSVFRVTPLRLALPFFLTRTLFCFAFFLHFSAFRARSLFSAFFAILPLICCRYSPHVHFIPSSSHLHLILPLPVLRHHRLRHLCWRMQRLLVCGPALPSASLLHAFRPTAR